jgi:hypothetical protein
MHDGRDRAARSWLHRDGRRFRAADRNLFAFIPIRW